MQKPQPTTRPAAAWTEFRADDTAQQSDAARDAEAWYDQQAAGVFDRQTPKRTLAAAKLAEAWAFPRQSVVRAYYVDQPLSCNPEHAED